MANVIRNIVDAIKRKDWHAANENVGAALQAKVSQRLAQERIETNRTALTEAGGLFKACKACHHPEDKHEGEDGCTVPGCRCMDMKEEDDEDTEDETEPIAEARTEPIRVKCLECGAKFKTRSYDPTCPKCHGADIDLAEAKLTEARDWKVGTRVKYGYSRLERARQNSMRGGVLGDAGRKEYERLRGMQGTVTAVKPAASPTIGAMTLTIKWNDGTTSDTLDYVVEPLNEAKEDTPRCEFCGTTKNIKKVDDTYLCKDCDVEEGTKRSGRVITETKMPASEVQRVYDETGNVGETELLCGIKALKVNDQGQVVSFVSEAVRRESTEVTHKLLEAENPFKKIGVPLPPLTTRVKKVNVYLHEVGTKFWNAIPLGDIFTKCKENGLTPVQEDGTPWSGFLTGRQGRANIDLVDGATGKVNRWLNISWYRMDSGNYEVVAYIS